MVLLQAYAKTFSRNNSGRLIIKGYPNGLNKAAEQVGKVRDAYPDMAELIFINDDVSEDSLLDLYKNSDAMVLPSRAKASSPGRGGYRCRPEAHCNWLRQGIWIIAILDLPDYKIQV